MTRTHHRLACSPSAFRIIAALVLTAAGIGGCEAPEDVGGTANPLETGKAHEDKPSCGQTSPCAAIFCGPGHRCVVVDTQPATAICEVIPEPAACSSNSDCSADMVCANMPGVCGHNPACDDPNGVCNTICLPTCVPKTDIQPARCVTNHDCQPSQQCSTAHGDCRGCGEPACLAVCYGVCESIPNGV